MLDKLRKEIEEYRKYNRTGKFDKLLAELSKSIIPEEPEKFYTSFGFLSHPRTNQPIISLAPYQIEVWKAILEYKRILALKSNKIGLTTSTLLADFQLALLPQSHPLSCRGRIILILAQNQDHANEHIHTLTEMALASNHSNWIMIEPYSRALRMDVTKSDQICIYNPDNPLKPTRIISLGINNSGRILSWKGVKHIHISDATAAQGNIEKSVLAAMTRLANTNGSIVIETVPSEPRGIIYDIYRRSMTCPINNGIASGITKLPSGTFRILRIPASEAVKADVMTQEYIDDQFALYGPSFNLYFGAQFGTVVGAIFPENEVAYCTRDYDLALADGALRILGVDWGFGSISKTAVVGIELRGDLMHVIHAEEYSQTNPTEILREIASLYHENYYSACFADSSHPGVNNELSEGSSELRRPPVDLTKVVFRDEIQFMILQLVSSIKRGKVRIHPKFSDLTMQLGTVRYDKNGNLDKSGPSFDLVDALMIAISHTDAGDVMMDKLN